MILVLFVNDLVVLLLGVIILCWIFVLWTCGSWCPIKFSNHLAEKERVALVGCIIAVV